MVSLVIRAQNAVGLFSEQLDPEPSEQADWPARIAGPGVVWYQGFESVNEVNNFRWTGGHNLGNDPLAIGDGLAAHCRWLEGEGPDGMNCLEILRPTSGEPSTWKRPLSPIVGGTTSGNGRGAGQDDPGAGTLTPQSYAPTDGGGQIVNWGARGYYAHESYHVDGAYDGTEYYLQMRVKMDPRRASPGMPTVGKLTFHTRTDQDNTFQEIVTYSGGLSLSNNPGRNFFRIYRRQSAGPLEGQADPPASGMQPNSDLGVCTISTPGTTTCWEWSGGWDTIMYRIRPGREGVAESYIQVYAAHEGETEYTKIWDMFWANEYGADDASDREGYNCFILSAYQNGATVASEFYHRYAQLIMSHEFIPCPSSGASAPSYVADMTLNRWYALSGPSPSSDLGLSPTNTVADVMGSLSPFSSAANDIDTPWNDWTGFVIAPNYGASGALACNGGGHQGSDWPGYYFFDFATRTWAKDAQSAPSTTTITNGLYSNGAPAPTHNSYNPHCRTLTGQIIQCVSETNPGTPNSKRVAFRAYDPETQTWSGSGMVSSTLGGGNGGCGVYDPELDRSIHSWGSQRWYYDWATGTATSFSYPIMEADQPGTFLPANGVRAASYMIMIGGWSGASTPSPFVFVNTASPTSASRITATPSGVHADIGGGEGSTTGPCIFFSPGNDALYVTGEQPDGLMSIIKYQCPSTIPGTWTGVDINPTAETPIEDWTLEPDIAGQGADHTRRKACLMVFSNGMEVLYLSGWPTHPVYGLRIR